MQIRMKHEGRMNTIYVLAKSAGVGSWFSVLRQASHDFTPEGRIAWVDVEGIPFKFWSEKTFKKIATKWVGSGLHIDGEDNGASEVPETIFENSDGMKERQSEDPFGLYSILNKNKVKSDVFREVQDKFKMYEIPLLVDISLSVMEEIVKAGVITMGYNMDGKTKIEFIDLLSVRLVGVLSSWKDAPRDYSNAMRNLCGKLKFLKVKIRAWYADYRNNSKGYVTNSKEELPESLAQASEVAQKAKIKWYVEGDENTKFFHGMLNKKRSQLNIRGIMINGTWTDNPKAVKQEFFQHFRNRYDVVKICLDCTLERGLSVKIKSVCRLLESFECSPFAGNPSESFFSNGLDPRSKKASWVEWGTGQFWSLEYSGSSVSIMDLEIKIVRALPTRLNISPSQLARKNMFLVEWDYVDVSSYEEWYTWLVSLRLQANFKAVFEGIFYCLWWSVWMFRNKILFEKDTLSQARIFDNIVSNSYYWYGLSPMRAGTPDGGVQA
ncbi:hypothetical protein Tco_0025881 [Tanacetum coccineum]